MYMVLDRNLYRRRRTRHKRGVEGMVGRLLEDCVAIVLVKEVVVEAQLKALQ
jgi:hypothetical protein